MKKVLRLDAHDVTTLSEHEQILVEKGRLWVTYEGDPKDYLVETGERLQPLGRNILVEALESTELAFEFTEAG
jgi:hypothetical protein